MVLKERTMKEKILNTYESRLPLALRFCLSIVILPHGAQKLLGWFGGPGFSGAVNYLVNDYNLPWLITVLVIIVEFAAPLFLLAGFLTRLSAGTIFILFIGIIFTAHFDAGFFMNWFGQLPAGQEGFEYHLLVLGITLALVISGGGKYSIDEVLMSRGNSLSSPFNQASVESS
jgi:putative oxidoreductase